MGYIIKEIYFNFNLRSLQLKMKLAKFCTPAKIYLALSVLSLIALILGNAKKPNEMTLGDYSCEMSESLKMIIYILKVVYILFVAVILDSLCKNGYEMLSYGLVFFPVVAWFAGLLLLIILKGMNLLSKIF